jgi:hypothetical protein
MSIRFKFKSRKNYENLPLKSNFIPVDKLKMEIIEHQRLAKGGEAIDLVLWNEQTGLGEPHRRSPH